VPPHCSFLQARSHFHAAYYLAHNCCTISLSLSNRPKFRPTIHQKPLAARLFPGPRRKLLLLPDFLAVFKGRRMGAEREWMQQGPVWGNNDRRVTRGRRKEKGIIDIYPQVWSPPTFHPWFRLCVCLQLIDFTVYLIRMWGLWFANYCACSLLSADSFELWYLYHLIFFPQSIYLLCKTSVFV